MTSDDDVLVIAQWIKRRPLFVAAGYWLLVLVLSTTPEVGDGASFPSWLGWLTVTLMDVYPFAVLRVILTSERQAQLGESRTGSFVLGLAAVPVLVTFIGVMMCGLPAWTMVVAGGVATAVVWMGSRAMRDVTTSPQP